MNMVVGLFGKLPARRDFVSIDVAQAFVVPWEQWLQAAMSASQEALGEGWLDAYGKAPVWRFWLGPRPNATAALGAFAPSLDGISRFWPLTVVATGDFAPPRYDTRDNWFEEVEAFLVTAVRHERDYTRIQEALRGVSAPGAGWPADAGENVMPVAGGIAIRLKQGATTATFAMHAEHSAAGTCWWTAGSASHPPTMLLVDGLPKPELFAAMLTGRWPAVAGHG